jgi:hypothetical protein
LPRGIRNNNPGDFKADGPAWQGVAGSDGVFYIFSDISWGLRALAIDLTNKYKRGLQTITGIISEYAPPAENNTAGYIQSVSDDTGIDPNADLNLQTDPTVLPKLMRAIINKEVGDMASYNYVADADIAQGISMMSGGLPQVVQAAVVYAQSNPVESLFLIGLAAALLWVILED